MKDDAENPRKFRVSPGPDVLVLKRYGAAWFVLFEYIEGFSTPHWRHSGLGYLSTVEHEKEAEA